MKVTFIFYDVLEGKSTFSMPLSILSACLKKAGHEVALTTVKYTEKLTKEQFLERLNPAPVYGFSALSGAFPEIKKLIEWIKEKYPQSFVMVGGSHALLSPEDVISSKGVDAVCIGEGEYCTVELLNRLEAKKSIYDIKNFWFKKLNGKKELIIKNDRLPLIENLDKLPFVDRSLFDYYNITDYKDSQQMVIMASRGCPYNCTYCANHKIRSLYPNKEKWLRQRSVDNVIREIKEVIKKYGPHKQIKFIDDTLVQNKEWFDEFFDKYRKEVGLPIDCQARPNEITDEVMGKLKKLGVKVLEMGIESGNPFIRYKIMKRYITNEQIINAYHIARKHNIPAIAFNIVGLPFETFDMMLDTVKLNALAKPSWSKVLYFQPFPNTEINDICINYGFLKDKIFATLFESTPLESPYVSRYQVEFINTCFRPLIKLYYLRPLWPVFDFALKSRFFPYRLFIKLAPLINLKETVASKYPKLTKALKIIMFWKK